MYYSNSVLKRESFVLWLIVVVFGREDKKSYFNSKNIYFYMKILLSWIGRQDILSAVNEKEAAIATAVKEIQPDRTILLNNFAPSEIGNFLKYIWMITENRAAVRQISLTTPTRHEEIYPSVLKIVEETHSAYPEAELFFHLSPGTPAMHAVWILIAKTQIKARLIETTAEDGFREVELPFGISLDYYRPKVAEFASAQKFLSADELSSDPDFQDIIFKSEIMTQLFNNVITVSRYDIPILLEGETGTGKEVLANLIHKKSDRKEKPFIAINCGAIAKDIMESELFGYVKGAFTGAISDKKGYFEAADGGTIFLDEIGDLPTEAQVKILRILNDGSFTRVGSAVISKTNVRVIAATHKSLFQQVGSGDFREDLFYRLAVVRFEIPPLRERREDLKYLIEKLFSKISGHFKKSKISLSTEANEMLRLHEWKGNIRELINTLQRLIILTPGEYITGEETKKALYHTVKPDQKTEISDEAFDSNYKQPGSDANNYQHEENFNVNQHIAELFTRLYDGAQKRANTKKEIALLMGFENHQTLDNWIKKYYRLG